MSVEWLSHWREQVDAALTTLRSTFDQKYGYPQGTNTIRLPNPGDRAAAAALAGEYPIPNDLATFYQHIAGAILDDVGNAYFIHSPRLVLDHLRSYEPVWLDGADGVRLLMIASDGGGIWFGVDADGSVYRSSAASTESDFTKVTGSLREFLDLLHRSIVRFSETGQPGYP